MKNKQKVSALIRRKHQRLFSVIKKNKFVIPFAIRLPRLPRETKVFLRGGSAATLRGVNQFLNPSLSVIITALLVVMIGVGVLGFGEEIMAQGGDLTVYANTSPTNIAVGDTAQFNVKISGGIAPYTYEWDFDDVDTYKNTTTSQNPSHIFNWAGKHYVEVKVTDSASNTEKVSLIINVEIDNLMPTVNAVSDCGCDNTGVSDCSINLQNCISNNYDASYGLRIEFPSGTYFFDEHVQLGGGANECYPGIFINKHFDNINKLEFVAQDMSNRPIFLYNNDRIGDEKHMLVKLFLGSNAAISHYLFQGIDFRHNLASGSLLNYQSVQHALEGFENEDMNSHITVEDCSFSDFGKLAYGANIIIRRCNGKGFGVYGGGVQRVETIRFRDDSLCKQSYFANGALSHSKIWYFTDVPNTYIVNNYADIANADTNQNVIQCKKNMQDSLIQGNLFKNSKGPAIRLVLAVADGEIMTNYDVKNNRIIAGGGQGGINFNFGNNCNFEDNFFHGFATGNYACLNTGSINVACVDVPSTSGNTFAGNVGGALAPGGSVNMYECAHDEIDECNPVLDCGGFSNTGNINNDDMYLSIDPSGWYDANGYLDPGPYEFTPPTVNSFQINNGDATTSSTTVTLNIGVTDSGSGMGSSARFPFTQGGLMMFSNDNINWYQVEDYATTHSWNLTSGDGTKTVYSRFRDVDGNWGDVVSDSILLNSVSTTYSISNFINLVSDWLKSESGLESDVNGDGVVNTRDLGIMMSNWQ